MSTLLLAAGFSLFSLSLVLEEPPKPEAPKVEPARPVGVRISTHAKAPEVVPQEEKKKERKRNRAPVVPEDQEKDAPQTEKKAAKDAKATHETQAIKATKATKETKDPVLQAKEAIEARIKAKSEAKPANKTPRKRTPATPKPSADEAKRLAEAETRAAKLAEDNARLQQELAKGQSLLSTEINNSEEALAELKAGNARFVQGKRIRTLLAMQDPDLRQTLAKGQAPFAVVVTCSDSRLMDNLIFDQELGRLFTIREAGNCPDLQGIASVEYAVEHLGSKVVVVLGHSRCGAIKAVSESHGKPLPGNLWSLQAAMAGLQEATSHDPNETPAEHLDALAENNACRQAQVLIDRSEIVRHLVSIKKIQVHPAMYDLNSGTVKFLELPTAGVEAEHH